MYIQKFLYNIYSIIFIVYYDILQVSKVCQMYTNYVQQIIASYVAAHGLVTYVDTFQKLQYIALR